MANDFTSLSFQIDIAEADKKIEGLMKNMKSLENKASSAASNISTLFNAIKATDFTFSAAKDLESTNQLIREMAVAMEKAKTVTSEVRDALKKGADVEGYQKQRTAIEGVVKTLLNVQQTIDDIRGKSSNNPNSLINFLDTSEMQSQMGSIKVMYKQIKDAEDAIASSRKKTTELSVDVTDIQKADVPSMFGEKDLQKIVPGSQGIIQLSESMATMNTQIKVANEIMPVFVGHINGINDQNISFANITALVGSFERFNEIGKSEGVAKFLEATRALAQLQVGSSMSAKDSEKAEDTAKAYATISGMLEKIGTELNRPENHIKAQVQFDTGAEAVSRLTKNIESIIPSVESSLADAKAIIKVPIDIDSANLKIDKSTEKINSIQDGIRKVVESSNSIKDRQVNMPPFIPTPPTKVSIEKIITDVRAFLRTKTIRLPSFIATRPSKESLDKVISEIRQLINERALRITNIALIKPSSDKVSAFVKDVQGMINTHNPTMNVVGIAKPEEMKNEIIGITNELKKLSEAAKIPGVPNDVMKSLESYGKELRSIATALQTIQNLRIATKMVNNEETKAVSNAATEQEKASKKKIEDINKEADAIVRQEKEANEKRKIEARAQVDDLDGVKELRKTQDERSEIIADGVAKQQVAIEKQKKISEKSISSIDVYTKSMADFKKSLVDIKSPVLDTGNAIQQIKLNPNNLVDPLKELRAELKMTDSAALNLARSMGMYVGGRSVINFFSEATRKANAFGIELRKIQSLESSYSFDNLSKGLMEIDSRFGNVIHNATTLYWAFSSGVRGTEKELVDFTETMAKTAITISADVIPTMDAATSLMNAYGLSARDAKEVGDLMFQIVKEGKASGTELSSSLGHVVATAASMGVSIDELGASIATLTRSIRTSRSLTYLNNILGKMINPTDQVRQAAEKLGVDFSMTAVRAKGFTQVMRELQAATGGNAEAIAQLFPDLRGQRAAITLLSTQFGDFEDQLEKFKNKEGSMESALGAISDTPEAQLRSLKNTMTMIAIEAGRTANSFMTLGGAVEPVLGWFNSMSADNKALAGRMAASGAAMLGMLIAQKAYTAAQYASAQASIQNNMLELESAKVKVQAAEANRKQALELKQLELAQLQVNIASKESGNETLRGLKGDLEAIKLQEQKIKGLQAQFKIENDINNLAKNTVFDKQVIDVARQEQLVAGLRTAANNIKFSDKNVDAKINSDTYALISTQMTALGKEVGQKEAEMRIKINDITKQKMEEAGRLSLDAEYLRITDNKGNTEAIAQKTDMVKAIMREIAVETKSIGIQEKEEVLKKRLLKITSELALKKMQEADITSTRATESRAMERVLTAQAALYNASIDEEKKGIRVQMLGVDAADKERIMAEKIALERRALAVQDEQTNINLKIQNELNSSGIAGMKAKEAVRKAAINELQRLNVAEETSTKNMLANADANVRSTSAISGRKGAIAAQTVAREIDNRALYLNNGLEKANAKETQAIDAISIKGKTEVANATKQISAAISQEIKLEKEKLKLRTVSYEMMMKQKNKELSLTQEQTDLQKQQNQMSIFDVGRQMGGKEGGGLEWSDVGMYGSMLAGRSLAAAFGPGAAMMSMLPMQKMWNTSKQMIGTATAAIVKMGTESKVLTITGLIPFSAATNKLTKHMLSAKLSTLFALKWEKKLNAYRLAAATTAGAAALGIGALAAAIGYLFSKTNRGGPMANVAEWSQGIKGLNVRNELLDYELNSYHERMAKNEEAVTSANQLTYSSKAELDATKERLQTLIKSGKTAEKIAQAQNDVNAATEKYSMAIENKDRLQSLLIKRQSEENQILNLIQRSERQQQELKSDLWRGSLLLLWDNINPFVSGGDFEKRKSAFDKEMKQRSSELKSTKTMLESLMKNSSTGEELKTALAVSENENIKKRIEFDRESVFLNIRTAAEQTEIFKKRLDVAKQMLNNAKDDAQIAALIAAVTDAAWEKQVADQRLKSTSAFDMSSDIYKQQEKDAADANQKLDKAQKALDRARTERIDLNKNYATTLSEYINSIPKGIQEIIQKNNENADYISIFTGEGERLSAAKKNLEAARKSETDVINSFPELREKFDTEEEALAAHNSDMKDARTKRMEMEKEFNSQLTRLAEMVGRTNESITQKMGELTKSRFERAFENPELRFGKAGIAAITGRGGNPLAVIVNEWNKTISKEAVGYANAYQEELAKNKFAINDTQIATNTQAASDALMKWYASMGQSIDNLKRLADAEKTANKEAYDLAIELNNAFKVTSQQAVRANSMDAVRLMSRSFSAPMQPTIENTAQERLIQMQEARDAAMTFKLQELQDVIGKVNERAAAAGRDVLNGSAAINSAATKFERGTNTFDNSLKNMPKFKIEVTKVY